MQAQAFWRTHPRQIASDLARFFVSAPHIKHWHRGTRDEYGDLIFSSYDLLELFGVTIAEPEMVTVTAYPWDDTEQARIERRVEVPIDPDDRRRLLPVDCRPERTVRIDFVPEDGALATALRGGERAEWKQMLAQTANISAIFRSAKFPNADTSEYGERLFFPMERLREFAEQERLRQAALRGVDDDEPDGLFALWNE